MTITNEQQQTIDKGVRLLQKAGIQPSDRESQVKKDKTILTRAICLMLPQKFEKSRDGEISLSSNPCWSSHGLLVQAELHNKMQSFPNNNI